MSLVLHVPSWMNVGKVENIRPWLMSQGMSNRAWGLLTMLKLNLVSVLVLLDFSTIFYTIDHHICYYISITRMQFSPLYKAASVSTVICEFSMHTKLCHGVWHAFIYAFRVLLTFTREYVRGIKQRKLPGTSVLPLWASRPLYCVLQATALKFHASIFHESKLWQRLA